MKLSPVPPAGSVRPLAGFTGAAFLFFLAYFSALYADVFFSGVTFIKRDILRYYYPVWRFAADNWKAWHIPFWDPYHSMGKPFAANIQNCVFYPLQLILHLPDYTWAFNFYIFVHLAMAGAFTAMWMRDTGASKTASMTAGLAFCMSGYMASAINLTISLCSAAYFPLALVCHRRALSENRFRWRAALAAVLTLQYLAGDPSILFLTLAVLALTTAWRGIEKRLESGRWDFSPAARLLQSAIAFIGLTAFHWPLFYQFLKQSNRAKMSYDLATMWSVQFNDLLCLVVPFFSDISIAFMNYMARQSWLDNYYAGVTVVILALSALLLRKDRTCVHYALLALFGLALALGRFSGVHWIFHQFFPFFSLIRYPVRFFFISYFALACLAGWAVDCIAKNTSNGRPSGAACGPRTAAAWALVLLPLAAAVAAAYAFPRPLWLKSCVWMHRWLLSVDRGDWGIPLIIDLTYPVFENSRRSLSLALAVLTALFIYRTGRARRWLLVPFLLALVTADLSKANRFEAAVDHEVIEAGAPYADEVRRDPGLFRVYSTPSLFDLQNMPKEKDLFSMQRFLMQAFTPNMLTPYRLSDLGGYDSIFLEHTWAYGDARWAVVHPARTRYYDLVNAKYFVSSRDDVGAPFELIGRDEKTFLYRSPNVLPRAFLVRRAEIEPDRKKLIKKILSPDFRPRETLFLQADPGWTGPEGPDGEGRVMVDRYGPEEVEMTVESPGPRWLFFSDAWYPAWHAWVDGRAVPIERANAGFRAVRVGPGTHRVVWKYDTLLFKMGMAVSLLTAAALCRAARR